MTFLPIVERELRTASRRSATYWSRLSTAAATVAVLTIMLYSLGLVVPTQWLSATMFQTLTGFVFIYALFVGARITADCISVEKRDGTLGLLFLTDLKGYDVALGKLAATSLPALYGLLASVPVLAIPLLLGGVGPAEFWRATLVLLNTLFFSLAAGMLVSTVSRHERKAAAGAILLIALVAGGLPLLGLAHLAYLERRGVPVASGLFVIPTLLVPYLTPSPAFACLLAFDRFYPAAPRMFWVSVASTHALGWVFLGAVSWIMPRVWQDRPGAGGVRWRERIGQWLRGNAARRQQTRVRQLERNPIYWLARRNWLRSAYVWFVLLAVVAGWGWGLREFGRGWLNFGVAVGTMLALQTIVKFWLAGEACGPFAEELRTGTLELLLSTPLSIDEILRGQGLALKRQVAGPALAVLVLDSLLFWTIADWSVWPLADRGRLVLTILAGVVMFALDLLTLNWVGMWLGLSSPNARKASGRAALLVLILPWLIFMGLTSAWSFGAWKYHWTYDPGPGVGLGLWFAIGVLADLFFWRWSRSRLHAEFRVRAMQRYAPEATASIWYQLGRCFSRWRYGRDAPRPAR